MTFLLVEAADQLEEEAEVLRETEAFVNEIRGIIETDHFNMVNILCRLHVAMNATTVKPKVTLSKSFLNDKIGAHTVSIDEYQLAAVFVEWSAQLGSDISESIQVEIEASSMNVTRKERASSSAFVTEQPNIVNFFSKLSSYFTDEVIKPTETVVELRTESVSLTTTHSSTDTKSIVSRKTHILEVSIVGVIVIAVMFTFFLYHKLT